MRRKRGTRGAHRRSRSGRRRARPISPGRQFARLVKIMQILRSPDGCPWDREQTLQSLGPFVLEETYEVLGAIDAGDREGLRDEIGDLLFEGAFLAQVAADEGSFTIGDALRSITDKLVRRHPHVFGESPGRTLRARRRGRSGLSAGQVIERWEQLKAKERAGAAEDRGLLAGIPKTLPSLLRAYEIGSRVAAVGFDWARADDVLEKIDEEVRELRLAVHESRTRQQEELGDTLFALANFARKLGIEPETALRRANEKFTERFEKLEARFRARGTPLSAAMLDQMEREWQEIKGGSRG